MPGNQNRIFDRDVERLQRSESFARTSTSHRMAMSHDERSLERVGSLKQVLISDTIRSTAARHTILALQFLGLIAAVELEAR